MKRTTLSFLLMGLIAFCFAQSAPQVPSNLEFGGMKLKITDGARKEIQKDVDALRASPKYFQIKVDRMNLYFPIVERIFKEERIPEEFKFLAIQESALISDAVSSANAVGFWQFKEPAAREVGLRIDRYVDERLNIAAASRGAAKYLKRMNFYFNNWVYACLAYNRGPGGAKKYVDESQFGVKKMTIDKNTFWYVKKFFAHYIAFKDEVGKPHSEGLSLIEYLDGANKSLSEIARKLKADAELVDQYNKWLKRGNVPAEKPYTVIVPFKGKKGIIIASKKEDSKKEEPKIEIYADIKSDAAQNLLVKVNNIKAIVASGGDNIDSLAKKGGIQVHHFLKFNDLNPTDKIETGEIYYLRNKKNKSSIYYHTVQEGESMRDISQKYGIKIKHLAKKNRMESGEEPKVGRIMWLKKKRPKDAPIEYKRSQEAPLIAESQAELPPKETEEEVVIVEEPAPIEEPEESFTLNEIPNDFSLDEDSETQVDNIVEHLVLKGQTLYAISKLYDVAVKDIQEWNGLESTDLKPGQVIQVINPGQVPEKEIQSTPESQEIIEEEPVEEAEVLFHEVAPGETLYSIARKYNLTVQDILEINTIDSADTLAIGQKLQLKKVEDPEFMERSPQPAMTQNTYTVLAGDTMYSIAKKFNLSVKDLMELNGKNDTNLSVGEMLKVSN
ncbi:MAG: LysM peptidoglycan-binding domain-containing protein [Cyclobacteriaceae bacterium]